MYYLKNPTNKLVTEEYMKIVVKDTKKPVIESKDKFASVKLAAGTASINYKKLLSGVTAKLVSGKNMTSKISIKVTDPNGKVKTVTKDGSYKFSGAGTYTVRYYCSNPEKSLKTDKYLVAEKKRKLIVAEKAPKPEEPEEPEIPEEPKNPTEPENPAADPVNPTEPENPGSADPVNPADPANPGTTDPVNPTTPATPENPVTADPTVVHNILVPADDSRPAGSVVNLQQNVILQTVTTMSDGSQRVATATEGIHYTVTYQLHATAVETDLMLPEGVELVMADTGIYKITYHYTDAQGNTVQKVRMITVAPAQAGF